LTMIIILNNKWLLGFRPEVVDWDTATPCVVLGENSCFYVGASVFIEPGAGAPFPYIGKCRKP